MRRSGLGIALHGSVRHKTLCGSGGVEKDEPFEETMTRLTETLKQ